MMVLPNHFHGKEEALILHTVLLAESYRFELPERKENRQIGGQKWKMYRAKNKKP